MCLNSYLSKNRKWTSLSSPIFPKIKMQEIDIKHLKYKLKRSNEVNMNSKISYELWYKNILIFLRRFSNLYHVFHQILSESNFLNKYYLSNLHNIYSDSDDIRAYYANLRWNQFTLVFFCSNHWLCILLSCYLYIYIYIIHVLYPLSTITKK